MAPCSLARLDYDERLEAAVNEQINTEYSLSYVYHALAAFMDRDNVGLPGFAAYFNASSADERHHAGRLMAQQNRRGGRVKLKARMTASSRPSQTMGMCASAHACVHACMHACTIHIYINPIPVPFPQDMFAYTHTRTHANRWTLPPPSSSCALRLYWHQRVSTHLRRVVRHCGRWSWALPWRSSTLPSSGGH
jgi:Ferritin-like domain